MTPEQMSELVTQLHRTKSHPSFDYVTCDAQLDDPALNAPPDNRGGWEANPIYDPDYDEWVTNGRREAAPIWVGFQSWRRRKDNVYTGAMEDGAIVVAAHRYRLHPDYEYRYAELPVDIRDVLESPQSFGQMLKGAIDLIASFGRWQMNTATPTGGFTLNGHQLSLHLFRPKEPS